MQLYCLTGAVDIVDGNHKLTLGIVYEFIKHFHINVGSSDASMSKKSALLTWFQTILPNAGISNFTTDWNDGRNLSALVEFYKPGLIPGHANLDSNDSIQNVTNAMELAETELCVPRVLRPEDIANDHPDLEFMVMAYLSFFCNNGSIGEKHLLKWVNKFLPNKNIENFSSDWESGQTLCALIESLAPGSTPLSVTLEGSPNLEVTKIAMVAAKESLQVNSKFTPKEICSTKKDQVPLMVYLAQLQSLGIQVAITPSALTAGGSGVDGGTNIQKQATIMIHGEGSSTEDLTILVTSPNGKTTNINKMPGSPTYQYTPDVHGEYTVEISFHGDHISGSPYHVIHQDPSLALKCITRGAGTKSRVNIPTEFSVDCCEAGKGKLSVVIDDPNGEVLDVAIIPKKDGTHQVKYTPVCVGTHTVHMNWNGIPIPNSPFTSEVCNPDKCMVIPAGLSNAVLGHPTQFDVHTEDAGPGSLSATVHSPSLPCDLDLISSDVGVYTYEYIPQHKGTYHIEIKWNGFQIPGSPFMVYPEEPTIASTVYVRELPVNRMLVNKPVTVIIDATDSSEAADINGIVQGPLAEVQCDVKNIEKGVFAVTFSPENIGEFTMEISYGGTVIPDCPLHFTINDPSKCKADDLSGKVFSINKPISFGVSTFDAGEGDITATANGPSGAFQCEISEERVGYSLVSFTPRDGGQYTILPYFDGHPLPGSPIQVQVDSESLDDIVISRPALPHTRYYLVDELLEIRMFAPNKDGERFAVNAIGKESGATPSVLSIEPAGEDNHTIKFKASISDDYKVHITYNNVKLPQSPLLFVVRQAPCAEKVISFDPVIPLKSGNMIELAFDTSQAGEGGLDNIKVEVTTDSNILVMHNIEEISHDLYRVSFRPHQNDTFKVDVKWFGKPANSSPFRICFEEQVEEPKVAVEFDPGQGPRGILSAKVVAQTSGKQEDIDVRQYECGKYQISFSPETKDIYQLHVYLFDQEIAGSPFTVDLLSPPRRREPPVQELKSIDVFDQEGVLSANVIERKTGHAVSIEPLHLSDNKDVAHISFDGRTKELYDVFVYWNNRLVKGAPFELSI